MNHEPEIVVSKDEFLKDVAVHIQSLARGDLSSLVVDLGNGKCIVLEDGGHAASCIVGSTIARLANIDDESAREKILGLWNSSSGIALGRELTERISTSDLIQCMKIPLEWRRAERISNIIGRPSNLQDAQKYSLERSI